jgi:hypothetical protein
MSSLRFRPLLVAATAWLAYAVCLPAQQEPKLSRDEMRDFLLHAKVIASKIPSKGVTRPPRLTLSDGTITHDASFQSVNEDSPMQKFSTGTREVGFRDSYKYNIAAYELAILLGLEDMMPVTVERVWQEKTGSLAWWLPVKMDEATRVERKIFPPDTEAWNRQMYLKRIFAELVYDTDPNLSNVLISEDWHLWMIDFTRAFRLSKDLRESKNILESKCSRQLLEKLRALDRKELEQKTKRYLTPGEIGAVMARRDKIVALFDGMIAKKGEKEVLFQAP